jgi:hypothetical protein
MKRQIDDEDIIITDKCVIKDTSNSGYNLGDLLNMPSLLGKWPQTPHCDAYQLFRMNTIGAGYENSILYNYCINRQSNDEIIPNVPLIIDSVNKFSKENLDKYTDIINIIKDPMNCCIHVRNGDCYTEDDFIQHIVNMSHKYKNVILLSGLHMEEQFQNNESKMLNFKNTFNSILGKNDNIFIYLDRPDVHIMIMANASNLLLHKGGFSGIGSIVSTGRLFVTKRFEYNFHPMWKKLVNKPCEMLD